MRANISRLHDKLMFVVRVTMNMSQRIGRLLVHLPATVTFNLSQLEAHRILHEELDKLGWAETELGARPEVPPKEWTGGEDVCCG